MQAIDVAHVCALYREFAADLAVVGAEQRELAARHRARMTPQLDDLEAEITYLLLRAHRPEVVVEVGSLHGWSTTWLLRALRDNGRGRLHTFDLLGSAAATVPDALAEDRWEFVVGDVRRTLDRLPDGVGHLFVDAAHSASFARWYLAELFPRITAGTPVSVHDVFHLPVTLPLHEGRTVVRWLHRHATPWLTVSRARARDHHRTLHALRDELGLAPVRGRGKDPMIFFRMPETRG